jgi:hypothetical protein
MRISSREIRLIASLHIPISKAHFLFWYKNEFYACK